MKREFRRNVIRLLGWYLFIGFCGFTSLVSIFCLIAILIKPSEIGFGSITFCISVGLILYASVRSGRAVLGWIRNFKDSYLQIDDAGVWCHFASTDHIRLTWNEIQGVTHEKRFMTVPTGRGPFRYRLDRFTILTSQGPIWFNGMDIPAPQKAAGAIAERIGSTVILLGGSQAEAA